MEATALKLPKSLEPDEFIRVPATWEEYMQIVESTPYTIQFLQGEIIGSQADVTHETIVPTIAWLLGNYFYPLDGYHVYGSNLKIAVKECEIDFNADLSVSRDPIDYGITPKGRPARSRIKNPEIVVEVLSKSTRKFDKGEKLDYYKRILTIKHILLIDQNKPAASVYSRTENPDEWLNHDYWSLNETVRLGEIELPMREIYGDTMPELPETN